MPPKIAGGYYKKARCITKSAAHKMPPYIREIWDYCLREANHADVEYGGHLVKRGQLFRTYKDIREDLSWYVGYRKMMYNENHAKGAMRVLRENTMIETTRTLGGVLITVVNYSFYQDSRNYENTREPAAKALTRTPTKAPPSTYNNKNGKNDNKEIKERFALFYNEYPKKKARAKALESFQRVDPDDILFKKIMDGVKRAKKSEDWVKDGGTFIPYPATWLNQKRWEDEDTPVKIHKPATPIYV